MDALQFDQLIQHLELLERWSFYGVAMVAVLIGVVLALIWSNYKPLCLLALCLFVSPSFASDISYNGESNIVAYVGDVVTQYDKVRWHLIVDGVEQGFFIASPDLYGNTTQITMYGVTFIAISAMTYSTRDAYITISSTPPPLDVYDFSWSHKFINNTPNSKTWNIWFTPSGGDPLLVETVTVDGSDSPLFSNWQDYSVTLTTDAASSGSFGCELISGDVPESPVYDDPTSGVSSSGVVGTSSSDSTPQSGANNDPINMSDWMKDFDFSGLTNNASALSVAEVTAGVEQGTRNAASGVAAAITESMGKNATASDIGDAVGGKIDASLLERIGEGSDMGDAAVLDGDGVPDSAVDGLYAQGESAADVFSDKQTEATTAKNSFITAFRAKLAVFFSLQAPEIGQKFTLTINIPSVAGLVFDPWTIDLQANPVVGMIRAGELLFFGFWMAFAMLKLLKWAV